MVRRKIHRIAGAIAGIYVIMATISGMAHIILSNMPRPSTEKEISPPIKLKQIKYQLDKISTEHGLNDVLSLTIKSIHQSPWYQLIRQESPKPIYLNTVTGKIEDLDDDYAAQIASQALGGRRVKKIAYLTNFSEEYLNIFRVLPVYHFSADDESGDRVYVSTTTGMATLQLTPFKANSQKFFSFFHKLSFIKNKLIRDIFHIVLLLFVLVLAISGYIILLKR